MRVTLLRGFVATALVANLAYAAWHAGALSFLGLAPRSERDPARLEQQIRPGVVRVLNAQTAAAAVAAAASSAAVGPPPPVPEPAASALPTAASAVAPSASPAASAGAAAPVALAGAAPACLEIGPLDSASEVDGAERTLATVLPPRAWVRESRPGGPQYAVYVPIMSRDAARSRREELVKLKIGFEAIELPGGREGGYSLGRHDSAEAARAALDAFRGRGLKVGSVVQVRANGAPRTWLRLDSLDNTAADAVRALPAAQLGGQAASLCLVGSVMSVGAPR